MQALILAAGTGARLGARVADRPKPCVEVGGRPLLAYAVTFARDAGASRVIVVSGHRRDQTEAAARGLGVDEVVFNERFGDGGNILSLLCARDAGVLAGDLLVMNSDHIYNPAIAAVVAQALRGAKQVTAFIDRDRQLGPDDMKVRLDDAGRIAAIDKQLDTFDVGYVGMTLVPAGRLAEYLYTADNVHLERGDRIHVEQVLQRMVGVEPAATCDISGHGWLEVDDEADWQKAQAALALTPWYPAPRP